MEDRLRDKEGICLRFIWIAAIDVEGKWELVWTAKVKKNISSIRNHTMDKLWNITLNGDVVLKEDSFINGSLLILKDFELDLINAIKDHGWDGNEDVNKVQWNFAGSLFYSIIVITTIGYGHIAPKTDWGKVVTIFYAILGIPLMLLCLSNIGDIMATSFRFLYWKVCCYVCTKKPKRPKRSRSSRAVSRIPNRTWRSRTASFRRSGRTSTRSQDSGFGRSEFTPTSHSDTELRYHDEMPRLPNNSRVSGRFSQRSRFSDTAAPVNTHQHAASTLGRPAPSSPKQNPRGGSLDRRRQQRNFDGTLDAALLEKTPVYCNRYAMERTDPPIGNHVPMKRLDRTRNYPSPSQGRRAISMPRSHYLEPPRDSSPPLSYRDADVESVKSGRRKKRREYNPSPAIMSPLGYGHRSKYLDDPESDDEYADEYYDLERVRTKPVPIWLCVFLVISYIVAGTFLFAHWESWTYLNSAYFCFITLTTIGFGDLFPSQRVEEKNGYKQNIAFCSLYLLFGIALLAMSFNLVQEEVIANVKKVAKTLGIIKQDEEDDDDD